MSAANAAQPLRNAKHEAVLQAFLADQQQVGFKAYLVVYPQSSEGAAKTGWSRLLKNADFAARLEHLKAAVTEKVVEETAITIERTVNELAKIAFASAKNYLQVNDDGEPMVDLSDLTDDQYAALAEVTVEDFVDGRVDADETMEPQPQGGELRRRRGRDVRKVRFKLHNKLGALTTILQHLGGFPATKHEHTGKDGGPISTKDETEQPMSERELGRRIMFALERAARAPKPRKGT